MRKMIAAGLVLVALILIGVACYSYSKKEEFIDRGHPMRKDFYRTLYDERWLERFPIQRLHRGE